MANTTKKKTTNNIKAKTDVAKKAAASKKPTVKAKAIQKSLHLKLMLKKQ